jgi:hypothetical protein
VLLTEVSDLTSIQISFLGVSGLGLSRYKGAEALGDASAKIKQEPL